MLNGFQKPGVEGIIEGGECADAAFVVMRISPVLLFISPQKWKQLSRLQRSLILFLLMLLLIFGLFSFPSITEQWRGKSSSRHNTLFSNSVCLTMKWSTPIV